MRLLRGLGSCLDSLRSARVSVDGYMLSDVKVCLV